MLCRPRPKVLIISTCTAIPVPRSLALDNNIMVTPTTLPCSLPSTPLTITGTVIPIPAPQFPTSPIVGDVPPPGAPSPGSSPAMVNQWWKTLTSDQQANWPLAWSNYFGSTDGIPAETRDIANRAKLQYRFSLLIKQYEDPSNKNKSRLLSQLKVQLIGMSDLWIRLNGQTVTGTLDRHSGLAHLPGISIQGTAYLMLFNTEGNGLWAMSIGDPDTAQTIVTTVSGVGRGLNDRLFEDLSNNDATITKIWASGGSMDQTAAIVWIGYDAPSSVIDLSSYPPWLTTDQAIAAAPNLQLFQEGLVATHNPGGPVPHMTVIGHSYGAVVIAETTRNGHMLNADDIVFIGCPGVPVSNAAALIQNSITSSLPAGGTQVWASVTPRDFINLVHPFGNDPMNLAFGATLFASDPSGNHGGYWQGIGLTNLADIALGLYDQVTTSSDTSGLRLWLRAWV